MDISLGTFTGTLLLGFLVWKATSITKYVTAGHFKQVLTQLVALGYGIGAVFLVGATDWAGETVVGNRALSDINGWSKVAVGLIVTSTASALYDFKKARDNADNAVEPTLLPKLNLGGGSSASTTDGQP